MGSEATGGSADGAAEVEGGDDGAFGIGGPAGEHGVEAVATVFEHVDDDENEGQIAVFGCIAVEGGAGIGTGDHQIPAAVGRGRIGSGVVDHGDVAVASVDRIGEGVGEGGRGGAGDGEGEQGRARGAIGVIGEDTGEGGQGDGRRLLVGTAEVGDQRHAAIFENAQQATTATLGRALRRFLARPGGEFGEAAIEIVALGFGFDFGGSGRR